MSDEPKFGEWRDIETAPKFGPTKGAAGPRVLLANQYGVAIGHWDRVSGQEGWHDDSGYLLDADRWMPLPPTPPEPPR